MVIGTRSGKDNNSGAAKIEQRRRTYTVSDSESDTSQNDSSSGPASSSPQSEYSGVQNQLRKQMKKEQEKFLHDVKKNYQLNKSSTRTNDSIDPNRREPQWIDPRFYQSNKNEPKNNSNPPTEAANSWNYKYVLLVAISIILAAIVACVLSGSQEEISSAKLSDNLKLLRNEFPSQLDDTWISLTAGARDFITSNQSRPLVVLLTGPNTEVQRCLGKKYIKAFNSRPYSIDTGDFTGPDYGDAIETLRTALEDTGAVLLLGLEHLDPVQATALHVVCDRESPLVKNAIVVMTTNLHLDKIQYKWRGSIEDDKLTALMTRLRDRVVKVEPEEYLPC